MNIHQIAKLSRRLAKRLPEAKRRYLFAKKQNSLFADKFLPPVIAGEQAGRAIATEVFARNVGGTEKRCTLPLKEQRRRGLIGVVEPWVPRRLRPAVNALAQAA